MKNDSERKRKREKFHVDAINCRAQLDFALDDAHLPHSQLVLTIWINSYRELPFTDTGQHL